MKLSASVMAHPSRRAWVEELLEQTGIGPDQVAWDTDGIRWHTGRRAWELYDPTATHHLVLQDDTMACRDLIAGVEQALEWIPYETSVSLFYGKPRLIPSDAERRWAASRVKVAEEAIAVGASWAVLPSLTWGPAFILPTYVIDDMLKWADLRTYPEYDRRVGRYAIDVLGWPCWHPWPVLVEHRGEESLCAHGFTSAYQFIGLEASALDIEWNGPIVWGIEGKPRLIEEAKLAPEDETPPTPPEPIVVETRALTNVDLKRIAEEEKRKQREAATRPPERTTPKRTDRPRRDVPAVTLSAAVMAHPGRAAHVEQTQERLDREVRVVWDERHDRWDTGRRAWLAYDPSKTHHAVIQDDLIIPEDLLAGIERALAHIPPDAPLAGYLGKVRPHRERMKKLAAEADAAGASWVTMSEIHWGPLIVLPTAHIPAMIDFCDGLAGVANYDMRLSRYWQERGARAYYTWPSIVDHLDGASLVPGRVSASRVAHRFCGADTSVLDLDWSGPVINGK